MKKLVLIMAVALLSVGAYGRDFVDPAVAGGNPDWVHTQDNSLSDKWCAYKAYPWTWAGHWEWDAINVATIKVYMDIGFWVSVKDCTNLKIKLAQDTITNYSGSVTMQVSTNIPLKFDWSWQKEDPFAGEVDSVAFDPSSLSPGKDQPVKVTLKMKKVDLSKYDGGTNCKFIGTLTIKVKPTVEVTIPASGGC